MSKVEVDVFDTTLRDGAQSLPAANQFQEGKKQHIARMLADLGVDVIEAGFPATPGDADEVRAVAETVGNTERAVAEWQNGEYIATVQQTPVIAGLSRTTKDDIEATWEAIRRARRPRIHTFISTDPSHMAAKFPGRSPEHVLKMGQDAIKHAKELSFANTLASVEFSAEAASTTDEEYLERVVKMAVDEGADVINVPDTVGHRDPFWMMDFYTKVIGWAYECNEEVVISAHNHNDLGMATANSLAIVRAAVSHARQTDIPTKVQIEGTVCGLGERAGNADLFVAYAGLYKFTEGNPEVPVLWRINRSQAVATAQGVMREAGMLVHRQSPVVGSDTNVHRSGIHSDGIIKGGFGLYTPYDPTEWGHPQTDIHEDGKYQGRRGRAVAFQS
ncbi:MAG: hypothetical protein U0520_05135 [Candidatus Saccharimonadales bacterium]